MKTSRLIAYNVLVVVVTIVALTGFTVGFVQHAIDENNKKFCQVIVTINGAPQPDTDLEPSTPYGKQLKAYQDEVTRDMRNLERDYKCPKGDGKP